MRRFVFAAGLSAALALGGCSGGGDDHAAATSERARESTAAARWTITDLGVGEAFAINNRGQIVGSAMKGEATQPFVWANGKKTLLPGLGGRKREGAAYAINDRGMIAGRSSYRAVVWQDGRARDLGALPGLSPESYGYTPKAVNSRGTIVGTVEWRTDMTDMERAFVYRQGKMVGVGDQSSIGAPLWGYAPWRDFPVDALRPTGDFVGACCALGDSHAFVWRDGRIVQLPSPPRSTSSTATAVNEKGTVVGSAYISGSSERAVVWRDGRPQLLPVPAGSRWSKAEGVNDAGEIVGEYGRHLHERAVLWRRGRVLPIGPPAYESRARVINRKGQVLIQTRVSRGSLVPRAIAYVWDDGELAKLPTLGGEAGVVAINAHNQIVGWSYTKGGKRHAVLWTPKR